MALRIAVDMDDVLVDFWPRVVECYNTEFGASLDPAKQEWDDNEIKQSPHFGEGKAYADWWEWWRDKHWLWATCDVIPGAIGGLTQLRSDGHYVELLTHKPEWARREAISWLAKWRVSFDRLTFVGMDEQGHFLSKAEASDADVLVDDKPQNIEEWVASERTAVLFKQPWNREFFLPVAYGRAWYAGNWNVVLEVIKELASE